jgi:type IV pilus secretin PilQ/predicted competence protein
MRRQAIVLLTMIWLILGMAAAGTSHASAASPRAMLKACTLSDPASGRELLLRLEGEYAFKTVQVSERTLFVDLKGVKLAGIPRTAQWSSGLLAGYRILQYADATGQPVVRVQVEMAHPAPLDVQRRPEGLRLLFGVNPPPAAAAAAITPVDSAVPSRVTATMPRPAATSSRVLEVSAISIQPGAAGETLVDVLTTRPTSFRVLQLKGPARLVVDLEGARNAAPQRSYSGASSVLQGVRVAQFQAKDPAVVRVVADLIGDPTFDVHASAGGVRIELRPRNMAKPPAVSTTAPHAPVLAGKPEVKPVQAAGAAAAPVVPAAQAEPAKRTSLAPQAEVIASQASAAVPARPEAKAASKLDYQSALPATTVSQQVSAAPRPVPPSHTPEALQAAKAALTLSSGSESNLAMAQGGAPGGAPGEEKPKYTGEAISLNLKDVDLKDFFRLIHEISGLNIIVDPNVTGSVTVVLESVPWDQALDIVLKNNHLGRTLEGNVLRIARLETLTTEQEDASKLAAAREGLAPLVTVFRPVSYAKSGTIAALLKSWAGGGALTKRGNILVDERTNTLIISDIQSQIPIIESIIAKLDKKAKQVAIEARIVLANASFSRSLQAALSGSGITPTGHTLVAGATGEGAAATPSNTVTFPQNPPMPSITVTPTGAAGFGAIAVSNAAGRYLINAAIAASENRGQAKTISRPSIVTQNNVAGTVTQGAQIPMQTSINLTVTVQYVNAALTLTVTPQVTDDGNIFMIINVTNASPGPVLPGSAGPTINTQSANTQVLVPDGGTVVFGGVTVTTRSKSATYVPLLGSIPIIGHLFKSSNVQDSDQELLFFVSPKVLPG